MPASGYSLSDVTDIAANTTEDNLIEGKAGQVLKEASKVDIFMTREAVDVLATIMVGGSIVFPAGPVNINTVVGSLPSVRDDRIVSCIAGAGDAIIVQGQNLTAGALELRTLVKVTPLASMALQGGRSG